MASLNPSSNHSNGTNKTANNLEDEDRVIQALDPTKSFSIIFRGDWTLDMMLLSGGARLRDDILDSLDQLLQTYQKSKVKVLDDVLLLRYVWLDADKVRLTCLSAVGVAADCACRSRVFSPFASSLTSQSRLGQSWYN